MADTGLVTVLRQADSITQRLRRRLMASDVAFSFRWARVAWRRWSRRMADLGVSRTLCAAAAVSLMLLAIYGFSFVLELVYESVRWDDKAVNGEPAELHRTSTVADGTLEVMEYHTVPFLTPEWSLERRQEAKRRLDHRPGELHLRAKGSTGILGTTPRWRRFASRQYTVKPHYVSRTMLSDSDWQAILKLQIVVRQFYVPLWPLAAVCAPAPGWFLATLLRMRLRNVRGRCIRCGYDVRSVASRCPECGRGFRPAAR